jgi:hypothetical protein
MKSFRIHYPFLSMNRSQSFAELKRGNIRRLTVAYATAGFAIDCGGCAFGGDLCCGSARNEIVSQGSGARQGPRAGDTRRPPHQIYRKRRALLTSENLGEQVSLPLSLYYKRARKALSITGYAYSRSTPGFAGLLLRNSPSSPMRPRPYFVRLELLKVSRSP